MFVGRFGASNLASPTAYDASNCVLSVIFDVA